MKVGVAGVLYYQHRTNLIAIFFANFSLQLFFINSFFIATFFTNFLFINILIITISTSIMLLSVIFTHITTTCIIFTAKRPPYLSIQPSLLVSHFQHPLQHPGHVRPQLYPPISPQPANSVKNLPSSRLPQPIRRQRC